MVVIQLCDYTKNPPIVHCKDPEFYSMWISVKLVFKMLPLSHIETAAPAEADMADGSPARRGAGHTSFLLAWQHPVTLCELLPQNSPPQAQGLNTVAAPQLVCGPGPVSSFALGRAWFSLWRFLVHLTKVGWLVKVGVSWTDYSVPHCLNL